jgi:type II secretory pathway component PulF
MPRFRYRALELDGTARAAELEAPSLDAARKELEGRGWTVESIELADADGTLLSDDDFLDVGGTVAELSTGGLPLESALLAMADSTPRGTTARALRDLGTRLQRGESWASVSASLGTAGSRVPPLLSAVVQSGLPPRELGTLLDRAVETTRRGNEVRRRVWMALMYSGVLLICLIATLLAFIFMFVPTMRDFFRGFGTEIPPHTQVFIDISDTIISSKISLVLWTAVGIGMCIGVARWMGAANRARLVRAIPVFGAAQRNASLATFCRLLGLSIEHHLPMTSALEIAGAGCGDAELSEGSRRMAADVQSGASLSAAVRPRGEFPENLVTACRHTDRPDVFAESLQSLGEAFESDSLTRTRMISVVVEPVMFVVIATTMIFVITTVTLPLIRLLNDLS